MRINEQLHFLNTKTKSIQSGTVVGKILSSTGYEMYQILLPDYSRQVVESAHCHQDIEQAESHKQRVLPLIEQAESLRDELSNQMDELRIQIIGLPQHQELANKLSGNQPIQNKESINSTD